MSDNSSKYNFNDLLDIMEKLRSDKGCPWDKEQTHESLTNCMIEEAYEACDAISEKDSEKMTEELGDVLLQVVFHAQIGSEDGTFNIYDITDAICRKLIFRTSSHLGERIYIAAPLRAEKLKIKKKGVMKRNLQQKQDPKKLPA